MVSVRSRILMVLVLAASVVLWVPSLAALQADDDDQPDANNQPPAVTVGKTAVQSGDVWTVMQSASDKWGREYANSYTIRIDKARRGAVTAFSVDFGDPRGRFGLSSGSRGFEVTHGDPAERHRFPKDALEKLERDVLFIAECPGDPRPALRALVDTRHVWAGHGLRNMLGDATDLKVGDRVQLVASAIPTSLFPESCYTTTMMAGHNNGSKLVSLLPDGIDRVRALVQAIGPVDEVPAVTLLLTWRLAPHNAEVRLNKAYDLWDPKEPPHAGDLPRPMGRAEALKQMKGESFYRATISLAIDSGLPIRMSVEKRPSTDMEEEPWVTTVTTWSR